MALRDDLLRLLRQAASDDSGLRAFLLQWRAALAGEPLAALKREFAALVDDAIERGVVDAFLDAIEVALPWLGGDVRDARVAADEERAREALPIATGGHGASPGFMGGGPVSATAGDGEPFAAAQPSPPSRGPSAMPPLQPPPATLRPQLVNLGFAAPDAPATPLVDRALAADRAYVFWVEIGAERIAGSAAGARAIEGVRDGDLLDVIVFGFPDQLAIGDACRARVELRAAGNQIVDGPRIDGAPFRLGFAIRTPATPGPAALRCNVYARGVLLQSHLVTATVAAAETAQARAVVRDLDYNLSARLNPQCTGGYACDLSLFANDDGDGTHSFRFVSSTAGVPEQVREAHIEGAALKKMVDLARRALRWSAWGSEQPWTEADKYKFGGALNRARLAEALKVMAVRGANLYMQIAADFGFGPGAAKQMREHMRSPGRVQIALKRSPDAVLPAALVYDYPIDTALPNPTLCDAAFAAIAQQKPLADEPCFQGRCPSYDTRTVFCPGGFWGFRHALGLPIHLPPPGEVASTIARGAAVRGFAPVSLDPKFELRDDHIKAMGALAPAWLERLDSRDAVLARLHEERHLVYFYCHGGVTTEDTPFLKVGELTSPNILAQSLFDADISWSATRPLVILNGCHTTATSPDAMFSMLTAFAVQANAAGVIGTEVTNFEPVAVAFGATFLPLFLAGAEVGHAVRMARLELLAQGNPLGLMYIPFALPNLQLV